MTNWVDCTTLDQCPPGSSVEKVVNGRIVALYNVDGQIHALDGICPHQGGPLGQGQLVGNVVTCPWHGWQFDVLTGRTEVNPRICQAVLPVRIDGDDVLISLKDGMP